MLPLHRDPWFRFTFAEARRIDRFRLEGVPAGRRVIVQAIDADGNVAGERLARARTAADGWVELPTPLLVRPGEGFRAVPEPDTLLREETPDDAAAVFAVHAAAFGQDDEARLVDALRAAGHVRVGLLAEGAGRILGHVVFGDVAVVGAERSWSGLALAPVAVLPDFQDLGIGSALIGRGLEECRRRAVPFVLVLGHPGYYERFGFRANLAAALESPFPPETFLALETTPGGLAEVRGRVRYPAAFGLGDG